MSKLFNTLRDVLTPYANKINLHTEEIEEIQSDVGEAKADLNDISDATCDISTVEETNIITPTYTSGYVYKNGTIIGSNAYYYTNKIPVDAGDIITCGSETGTNQAIMRVITAYNGNVVIEESGVENATSYTVPSNIDGIVITGSSGFPNTPYIVRVSSSYNIFKMKTDPLLMLDRTITESSGYYTGNGTIAQASETQQEVYTNQIDVTQTNVKWELSYPESQMMWIAYVSYDKNGNFLGRTTLFSGNAFLKNGEIEIPDNVENIAFTYRTYGEHGFSIEVNPNFDNMIDASIDNDEITRNVVRSSIGFNPFRFKPYMSHMYVGNTNPPIPNQSIYDIKNSKKLGFDVIEANVQKTSDGKYICWHGSAGAFGNCVHHVDGTTDITNIAINSVTLDWIQQNVRYNSQYDKYKTAPTVLEDFLYTCRVNQMIPMITGIDPDVIAIANRIMGKDNYISYGGKREYTSAPILGFASKTTKTEIIETCDSYGVPFIYSMGNPTYFTDSQLKEIVDAIHEKGYLIGTASSYIPYKETLRLLKLGFDMSASSLQVNDFDNGNVVNLYGDISFDQFDTNGTVINNNLVLQSDQTIIVKTAIWSGMPIPFMAKSSLRVRLSGEVVITIGGRDTDITSDGADEIWLSAFYNNLYPQFVIKAISETTIYSIEYHASNL